MIVGNDVALGIDDDAGTQGTFAKVVGTLTLVRTALATLPTLSAKKAVEEILERAVFVTTARSLSLSIVAGGHAMTPAVRVLDRRFGADVDHRWLHLASDLGKLVRQLHRRGNLQRSRVGRGILLLALHASGDNCANQNTEG